MVHQALDQVVVQFLVAVLDGRSIRERCCNQGEKPYISRVLVKGSWNYIRERLMFKDPVLEAAKEFGKRLKAGEETLLSKEESARELQAIREEQKDMRKTLDDLTKGPP
jgi:hypothetical protein